jgi:hypothetical protein
MVALAIIIIVVSCGIDGTQSAGVCSIPGVLSMTRVDICSASLIDCDFLDPCRVAVEIRIGEVPRGGAGEVDDVEVFLP